MAKATSATRDLHLTGDAAADALLSADPLALLLGMVLDQQIPMEKAFSSPRVLAERLGTKRLDAKAIAEHDPEALAALFATPPALHRFPGSMAGRVQEVCAHLVATYGGKAAALWEDARSGDELLARIRAVPGFGEQKARIFLALLGKQCGVRPEGWREAAGGYGPEGTFRSVADVHDQESLLKVRAFKKAAKAAAKAAAENGS